MAAFETAAPDLKPLLGERISRLGLKLEGYPMERYVADLYRLVPFHRGFVRHMEGWYAQKPPDEDFAETL